MSIERFDQRSLFAAEFGSVGVGRFKFGKLTGESRDHIPCSFSSFAWIDIAEVDGQTGSIKRGIHDACTEKLGDEKEFLDVFDNSRLFGFDDDVPSDSVPAVARKRGV